MQKTPKHHAKPTGRWAGDKNFDKNSRGWQQPPARFPLSTKAKELPYHNPRNILNPPAGCNILSSSTQISTNQLFSLKKIRHLPNTLLFSPRSVSHVPTFQVSIAPRPKPTTASPASSAARCAAAAGDVAVGKGIVAAGDGGPRRAEGVGVWVGEGRKC